MMGWIEHHRDGSLVRVWAVPRASRTEIVGLHDDALRVRLAAAPEAGRANRELQRILKTTSGAAAVELISGATSRKKALVLHGVDPVDARRLLDPRGA
ncbi:MAG: DUF167 domain-containing protein [Acidimicrobiia bacterium]|nr:MAG: DUF167 domain-containing protein [Acidimicrobiia bacterium]